MRTNAAFSLLSLVGYKSLDEIGAGEPVETLSNTVHGTGHSGQHVDENKSSSAVEPTPATVHHNTPAAVVADTQTQGFSVFILL